MRSTATVRDRYSEEEIQDFYASGFWQSGTMFDLVAAQADARPGKVFVSDSTSSLTYQELHDRALRLALGFERLGLQRGDRVTVQLPNWSEFVLIAVALGRLGVIVVPIMPVYRAAEVGYILGHAGAKAAITCEEFRGFRHLDMYVSLQEDHPDLQSLIVVRGSDAVGSGPATRLSDLIVDKPSEDIARQLGPAPSPDDAFVVVYTSGTTSRPKGCLHTFNTLRASAAAIAKSLAYQETDVQFGPSPITHGTGLVTSFALPLLAGASSHLMEKWEALEGLHRIREYGCTVAVTATAFLQMLTDAYDVDQHDLRGLRLWVCAGAPIPGSIVQRARELLPGCRVLSLYGRTENFLTTLCTVDDTPERSIDSDGSAVDGAMVAIVDELGREVPPGTEGDIAYRGPSHMLGYFRDPEATAALFTPDGFSRSGDLGFMDEDGYVRVAGRIKDIVIRGGLNISARELEDLLVEHPGVSSVAVVGMPDVRLGEKVCAYVVPAHGQPAPRLEDLTSYLRRREVATPKLPERLELVERLPVSATGKVLKHVLRDDIARKLA
ncbi:AMP-binding protein [Streptomyces sp. NPDC002577]